MDSIQSMASSSSATVPPSERASHFVSQTEVEMESSKARHWSQLDYSTSDWEWSAESNFKDFAVLKEDPQWGRFFRDFETLEVGEKISEGAQADIYEARMRPGGPFSLVVKVMKGDAPLKAFQAQWPIGMLLARSNHKRVFDLPLVTILGGTVLRDQRVWGRFAFVMRRRWGDLRPMIDRRMKEDRKTLGPFPIGEAIHLMLSIAEDVDTLHNKHEILHRDLKASNVLVWIGDGEAKGLLGPHHAAERIGSVVADFECSVGVLGTGFWRAPEILEQLKDRVPCSEVQLTHASDVYSYGMICYEIITGCIPYDGLGGEDTLSQILQGHRPELPHDLPEFVRDIIVGCWHSDPLERPSFSTICMALKLKKVSSLVNVIVDNKSKRGASIVKVEQWNIPKALTLLEVMQKLIDLDLSILRASDLSSTSMIRQCFKVTDCKGRKVVKDKSIANITKALSLRVLHEAKWISKSLEASIDENANVQMHVVEIIAKSAILLRNLSRLFVATKSRVHSVRYCTRKGQVECFIYVEGARMGTLLWEVRHNMEYFQRSPGLFKIMVHRVAAEVHRVAAKDSPHLNRRLHNLKSLDLTLPSSSTDFCIHLRKEFEEGFQHSTKVVLCFKRQWRLFHLCHSLRNMGYKIVQASVEYPGPYRFLKGRVTKSEDIDVEGKDELIKINHISEITIQRGYIYGNYQLIVPGPSQELYDDLARSFRKNNFVVSGGQLCSDGWELDTTLSAIPIQSLKFFVTGKYCSDNW